jgi:hypothetical protein
MPGFLRPRLGSDSKTELSFPQVKSRIGVALEIRSQALSHLLISEFAHADENMARATLGACGPKTCIILESTANGYNWARDFYLENKAGETSFRTLFIPWWAEPSFRLNVEGPIRRTEEEATLPIDDAQLAYRRQKRRELKGIAAQELAENDVECFLASGQGFFDGLKISTLLMEARRVKPVAETPAYAQWERPSPDCVYVAGADVAEGAHDYSVLAIICARCRRTVFRYRARASVSHFARICDQ